MRLKLKGATFSQRTYPQILLAFRFHFVWAQSQLPSAHFAFCFSIRQSLLVRESKGGSITDGHCRACVLHDEFMFLNSICSS